MGTYHLARVQEPGFEEVKSLALKRSRASDEVRKLGGQK